MTANSQYIPYRCLLWGKRWNPTDEEQAIRRSYRIGQRRDVVVSRLVIADSIEERIVQLNEEKRSLATAVLDAPLSAEAMARVLQRPS